ncbi:hypothetical protein KIN20_027825 [Parelaphostrongylus tenuis]|uniref:Uncharacterized protein n=1 Tax=Parelaphostrongylus tenuis TaxID=148309 RepID=A0AAD5WEG0_PARTN|nr:hypothetical protein KIN20_027825 [Parelaphostrongylus tenuis]
MFKDRAELKRSLHGTVHRGFNEIRIEVTEVRSRYEQKWNEVNILKGCEAILQKRIGIFDKAVMKVKLSAPVIPVSNNALNRKAGEISGYCLIMTAPLEAFDESTFLAVI